MTLSVYHQKFIDQSTAEIQKKADAKEQELKTIFNTVSLKTDSDPVKLAVLGCGDKRFIAYHKKIFEKILNRNVEVTTFDITIDHLKGEPNIFRHDCTLPLPNTPYDITYAHVLLKFIKPEKQFKLLQNSFDALKPGGITIHCFDRNEINATSAKLPDGLWSVPLEQYTERLSKLKIEFREIPLQYGPALVLLRK